MEAIKFDCRWSPEITSEYINDFISVLENVWKHKFDFNTFQCRYINNLYGPSLLVLVYIDGHPSGTQAFWRNDIGNRIAYQADDGAVIEVSRGRGLLGQMIQKGMEILGDDVLLYSYPNYKSKSSFIRMGWNVLVSHPIQPLIRINTFIKKCPQKVDYDYAKWFLHKRKHISYVNRNNHYFLIMPTSYRFVDYIISGCDKHTAMLFKNRTGRRFLVYNNQPNIIDKSKKGNTVVWGHKGENIPIWKCDAI